MTIEEQNKLKLCFKRTFDSTEGKTMLAWIAKECGQFETDPSKIRPDLQAFFNRLMWIAEVPASKNMNDLLTAVINISSSPDTPAKEDDNDLV